jgi:NAD-specific glutamate dehydrogenase
MVEDMLDHPSDARQLLLRSLDDHSLTAAQLAQAMEEADVLEEDEILRTVVDRLLQLESMHRAGRRHRARLLARADAYDEALTIIEPMTRDSEASFEHFDLLQTLLGRAGRLEEASSIDEVLHERWPTEAHKPLW